MNFLMHIYLSREDKYEMIGNFLGDFIKAGREKDFDKKIERGIILHWKIDGFSDRNPIFKKSKKRFPKELYRFSGIAIDIIYDHFLAKHFEDISSISLDEFLNEFYNFLSFQNLNLREREKSIIKKIIEENWLYRYKDFKYAQDSICRLSKRFKRKNSLSECCKWFEIYYLQFEDDFFNFLPEVERFTFQIRKELL